MDTRRIHLAIVDGRVHCESLHATLSVGTCAAKHVKAKRAWARELATRTIGRPDGLRGRDRGEFGPCRDCATGAFNAEEVMDAT